MMTLSFCGMISLLLLSVSSMQSDESVPDFNEISERIKKHNLHPRRALWGIDSCPSDFYQHGNSCCKTGTTLCCRMDGEGCYCRVGQILRQSNRGEPDGCGSALTGWGDIQQATFSEPGMKEACDQHDWCYTDCSKTHKQCDDEWYNAADQVCWDLYWNPLTSAVAAWDWLFGLNAGKGQCHGKVKAAYDYMSSYSAWMSSIGNSCSCDGSGKTHESIYKGCFKDDSARDFKVFIGRTGLSYPKRTCMSRCINYKYFSLQDGGNSRGPECFCSNDIKSNPGRYPQVADKECEVDGTLYGGAWRNAVYEITPREFHKADNEMSLNDARAYCEGRDQKLVVPKDQAETDQIKSMLGSGDKRAWVGINQNSGNWASDDSNFQLNWQNWKAGEGNDGLGASAGAAMIWQSGWTGQWYDMRNDGRRHAVVCVNIAA